MIGEPKRWLFTVILAMMLLFESLGQAAGIKLLVRADDMGSFHSANLAVIDAYQKGIVKSVELMVPCAWFPEAVSLLNKNPGLDVGIHLVLTSEWSLVKWRPLTNCPSLIDKDGYFLPMVWKNEHFPAGSSLSEVAWNLAEVEQELRAQIELALRYLPQVSHLSSHMGFTHLDPKLKSLVEQLADEYNLMTEFNDLQWFSAWDKTTPFEKRIDSFCEKLEDLQPGNYFFLDHPAFDDDEMQSVGHIGYEFVASDREWVRRVFTSEKVLETIEKMGIELIGYHYLRNNK